MKREEVNGNGEDRFARELAGFDRASPPESWRDELIANALPATGNRGRGLLRKFRFSLPERIIGGGLAAAWLLIIGFSLATPADLREAKEVAARAELWPDGNVPLLAWRLGGGQNFE